MATYSSMYDTSYGFGGRSWGSSNWYVEPSKTILSEKESKNSEVYFDPKNLIV